VKGEKCGTQLNNYAFENYSENPLACLLAEIKYIVYQQRGSIDSVILPIALFCYYAGNCPHE